MQKYEIMDIIDEGAYGIVWKAINKQTQEFVAIKEFKQTDEDEDNKRTIQREIKMLKMLKSDHVVGIREAFKKKGKIYLIFEYFPQNLLNLIEFDPEGLQASFIREIVYKIVKCLKFLHTKNVIHRDIKPQNILLSQNKNVLKLCDFGFARFIPENLKQMTDYVATRWYRSPELLVGEPYHKPSDMFALGCIIGELVDGQPMFPGENEVDQLFLLRKSIGQLTQQQQNYMRQNPKFAKIDLEKIKKRQPLQQRYLGKIEKNCLSFMKACLKMDAQQRLTAQKALKHPYLIELSTKYNDLQNDEQNLLQTDRKTVAKHDTRASVMSMIQDVDETKVIEDSIVMGKTKTYSKAQKSLKQNYESADYSGATTKHQHSLSNHTSSNQSNQMLNKKGSHQVFHNNHSNHYEAMTKDMKQKKTLKKNMSQEKHLKLNLDVNVNINLKINKKSQFQHKNIVPTEAKPIQQDQVPLKNEKNPRLPQLKPKGFMLKKKDDLLMGLGRHLGEKYFCQQVRNSLSINGQSKDITKTLISKKLVGMMGH